MTVRTLIVGAAPLAHPFEHYAHLITSAAKVIAADGGLVACLDAGRVPDVCIGDFDSTPPGALAAASDAGAEIVRFPVEKDVSDLDLAVDAARSRFGGPLVICGAFTGRLDHTLSALGTLVSAADLEASADEPGWRAIALDATTRPRWTMGLADGVVVSVFAVGGAAVVSATGFAYPMERTELRPLSSRGLSNVSSGVRQSVTVHTGTVVVFVDGRPDAFALQSGCSVSDTL